MRWVQYCQVTLCMLMGIVASDLTHAHPLDPAFLQIREQASGEIRLRWSGTRDFVTRVDMQLPGECSELQLSEITHFQLKWVATSRWHCRPPLSLKSIEGLGVIEGAPLILDYQFIGQGKAQTTVIVVENGCIFLPRIEYSFFDSLTGFILFGMEHIALGFDHLLFVFCLLLLYQSKSTLIRAITAFTLGHSVTLFLCATDLLLVSPQWAESCVALSLVFMCRELLVNSDHPSLMRRSPTIFTLRFGLIHGLGFATALKQLGLNRDNLVAHLMGFNMGVEIGQLIFILLVLSLGFMLRAALSPSSKLHQRTVSLLIYGSGIVSTYWFVERIVNTVPHAL